MALTPQPLMRAQDTVATTYLGPITPKNWKTHANKVNFGTDANPNDAKPRYNQADYAGNAYGHDVTQAKANIAVARPDGQANDTISTATGAWRTQSEKATALGIPLAQDVGRRPGWIAPNQPYGPPPLAAADPTIATLAPATAVAGAATPQFVMKINGTNFTPYTQVVLAGTPAPVFTYVSPTEMRVQMSPASSSPGTTTVQVVDHGVVTAAKTFTWT